MGERQIGLDHEVRITVRNGVYLFDSALSKLQEGIGNKSCFFFVAVANTRRFPQAFCLALQSCFVALLDGASSD